MIKANDKKRQINTYGLIPINTIKQINERVTFFKRLYSLDKIVFSNNPTPNIKIGSFKMPEVQKSTLGSKNNIKKE